MSSAAAVAAAAMVDGGDAWEAEALRQEFCEAVQHVGTSPGVKLTEAVQRRLFGLHCRVTRGRPPAQVPAGEHEEQWQAWCEAGEVSEAAAMQEYVDLVARCDPEYIHGSGDSEMPPSELPPGIREQLAAAGLHVGAKDAGAADEPADVFAAARAGKGLSPFLPAQRDAVDADGLTPLIHAVDAEQSDAVAELLLAGAAPDAADPQGSRALHYAALLGSEAIAEQLLAAGADPRVLDVDGASPAETAREEGHATLADKLAEACAKYHG
mmetsp:Transcript_45582/g.132093  ORF Transcript_45582/g.132093 Transcript_45582/m.132093 type:complete len:268 (-) Transcript_45582:221-1024(-)